MKIVAHSSVRRNIHRLLGIGGALIIISTVSACSFEVQPVEEFMSESENLTFRYPAVDAVIAEESAGQVISVFIATRQDQLALDFIPPDEAGIAIQVTPSVVAVPGGAPQELSTEEFAESLRQRQMQVGAETDMRYFVLQREPELLAVTVLSSASGMDATQWMPDNQMAPNNIQYQRDMDAFD